MRKMTTTNLLLKVSRFHDHQVNIYIYFYLSFTYICIIYIYLNKKNTQNLFKLQIFLFFSVALSMYNKIANESTDNSAT